MKKKEALENIQQSWIHSHEEDTGTEMVYRPADYEFPLSRGRSGFALKPDHKLVEINIAATDNLEEEKGSWKLIGDDNNNQLTLEINPNNSDVRQLKVKEVDENRLIVEKE